MARTWNGWSNRANPQISYQPPSVRDPTQKITKVTRHADG